MQYSLNPRMSYIQKQGCYAIYVNYNLYFLQNEAASLFEKVLQQKEEIPSSYITFLEEKEILEKGA